MWIKFVLFLFALNIIVSESHSVNDSLVTNWEYYGTSITSGLNADSNVFYLNGKEIFIYSGAFHYFRVPRAYWRDRLRMMRAAGLNAVETYIPWNLHEPLPGVFDFGGGGNDMSDFLYLSEFLTTAKEEDLFVIIRSGPFICAEFEFGGFPSWLLSLNNIEVRTSNSVYMERVTSYFDKLMAYLSPMQFTVGGGPIIMFQVENEYSISGKHDLDYLKQLRQMMLDRGIVELLVTADNPSKGTYGTLSDLFLMTGNFDTDSKENLDDLAKIQPGRPRMVMEYWGGWFDFWASEHVSKSVEVYKNSYEPILQYPSSVNVYMFVGGTNFGFLNGAQNLNYDDDNTDFHSIISSYDYLSPISESGDLTDKYYATKELIDKYNPIKTKLPDAPAATTKVYYDQISINKQIYLWNLLDKIDPVSSTNVVPMEKLNVNGGAGQSYGYIVYRKWNLDLPANAVLQIEGRVCDTFMVLVNGVIVSPWLMSMKDINNTVTSHTKNPEITLTSDALSGATLDIVVENWGRVNIGAYKQFKGLWQGGVKVNGADITEWSIYPLDFKTSWTNSLNNWVDLNADSTGPVLYSATLNIPGTPQDTFVHMENWIKGIVIVNGFVLGRYAKMGPIQTLYLPAPLLKQGDNSVYIFEHYKPDTHVYFSDKHVYKNY